MSTHLDPFDPEEFQQHLSSYFDGLKEMMGEKGLYIHGDSAELVKEKWGKIEAIAKELNMPSSDFQILYAHYDNSQLLRVIGEINAAHHLGIKTKLVSMVQLFDHYHKKQRIFINILAKAVVSLLLNPQYFTHLTDIRYYSSQMPIRLRDNKTYLMKVTRVPFVLGEGLSVIMNYYHKLGLYQGEPLLPHLELRSNDNISREKIMQDFRQRAIEYLRDDFINPKAPRRKFPFSPREMEVLKVFHENPGFTNEQVAEQIYLTKEAVKSINKSIFRKARELFARDFNKDEHKTKDIAEYWVNQGLAF